MVRIKNPVKQVVLPLTLGTVMLAPACKKEEEAPAPPTKTDLLLGDWKITEVGGYDFTQYDYSYLFKFQAAGDFQFCYEDPADTTYNYCYSAKWRWKDASETRVIMDKFSNDPTMAWILDVVVLDDTRLEGGFWYDYDPTADSTNTVPIKFVKVQ